MWIVFAHRTSGKNERGKEIIKLSQDTIGEKVKERRKVTKGNDDKEKEEKRKKDTKKRENEDSGVQASKSRRKTEK